MKLITKKELAEIIGVSIRTIERYHHKGLPIIKIGRTVRYDLDEVSIWIKNN